ncbi:hypothetical protein A2U01_0098940 [Trifolium medium]|nr:hypothetical protein [Trifolium medium]
MPLQIEHRRHLQIIPTALFGAAAETALPQHAVASPAVTAAAGLLTLSLSVESLSLQTLTRLFI